MSSYVSWRAGRKVATQPLALDVVHMHVLAAANVAGCNADDLAVLPDSLALREITKRDLVREWNIVHRLDTFPGRRSQDAAARHTSYYHGNVVSGSKD